MNRTPSPRKAFILVATLAIMAVLVSLLLPIVPRALANRRLIREDLNRVQADYVMRAAVERALMRLEADDDYAGEEIALEFPASSSNTSRTGQLGTVQIKKTSSSLAIEIRLTTQTGPAGSASAQAFAEGSLKPHLRINKTWEL